MRMEEKRKRLTRKQRRILKKRRQRRRRLAVLCAMLCLGFLITIPVMMNMEPQKVNDEAWVLPDENLEIAAPPLENGSGTLDVVNNVPTLAPFNVQTTPAGVSDGAEFSRPQVPTMPPEIALDPTLAPETVSVTITAAGDCTLGGDTQSRGFGRFAKAVQKNGYDFFLANVRSIFEADDITIVNLEGPLTTSSDARSGRRFLFKGDPEYVQILTCSSVEVCNVANNHAKDFGRAGQEETLDVLSAAGIGASGYGKVYYEDVRGVRVGFVGLTEWDYSVGDVRRIVEEVRAQCDLLIVSIHWGEEGNYKATATQKTYGHEMIDAGADLVLGHHPHVLGGVEQYNGKYIVYSLGNFCFGGNGNPSDKDTLIFQQRFDIGQDGTVQDGGINIIPCSVSSVKGSNNFQPTPLQAEAYTKLLKKIGKYSDVKDPVILTMEN